ncbi:holo-ACP synthase [Paenibacillus sp. J2TS4]|uniref:holo-ACP synthase n=1 Tax=Paenibacillus sp. J2TS4 TaxID=2807194 RepID=UPI001B07567E|nr:holo-ACP synthase [Paenibacillus sp. J2TS4]GIP34759.1 holo-[acyl-carrier-protein] synthase [Paenibacillus sp. J2TS4]
MIIGVGTDVIEIARVKKLMSEPSGPRFVERILTHEERRLAENRQGRLHEYVAGRFAAKEAVAKALACGIGRQVGFQDIEVLPDPNGKPECTLSVSSLERLNLGDIHIHLSISHSETVATAFAVAERPYIR